MFERRLAKGQHHTQPYLGCREFAAAVEPAVDTPIAIDRGIDRPLGWMFFDFDWSGFDGAADHRESEARVPLFFPARLTDGVVRIPARAEVQALDGAAR